MSTTTKTKVRVSLAFFDQNFEEPRLRIKRDSSLKKWQPLEYGEYQPRGSTPLLDATADMIRHLDGRLADDRINVGILIDESGSMSGKEQAVIEGVNEYMQGLASVETVDAKTAGKAICVIFTDGYENASVETGYTALAQLVAARERAGWTFIYLGANQDAWATGMKLGFSGRVTGQTVNVSSSPVGVASAMRVTAADTVSYLTDTDKYTEDKVRTGSSKRTISEEGEES